MNKEYIIIERFKFIKDKNAINSIWYDFSNIPQEKNYITICALPITTDRKAINRAKKINPNYEYIIKDRV
tara:strand:- start:1037 stop:1246 length:210 start_codon:yes stop_codon:yes gene_type:complete